MPGRLASLQIGDVGLPVAQSLVSLRDDGGVIYLVGSVQGSGVLGAGLFHLGSVVIGESEGSPLARRRAGCFR
jgi:hypothetical protein